jgi:uncharacterized protein YndB with AHSA1/START domain
VRSAHAYCSPRRLAAQRDDRYHVFMRDHLTVEKTLPVPAEALWDVIASGERVERWFEWVAETIVKDAAEGGSRLIRMRDGNTFEEWVTINDRARFVYQYFVPRPPLPVRDVIGTMRLDHAGESRARVIWSVSLERVAGAPDDLLPSMRALYVAALDRIESAARGAG